MSKRTQLAYLSALFTLGVGILGLVNPFFMSDFVGLSIEGPRGLSTMRSVFGVFFIGVAAAMIWGLASRPRGRPWVLAASFVWLTIGFGRFLSALPIDFAVTPLNLIILGIEFAAGLSALFAGLETPDRQLLEEEEEEYVSRT